MSTFLSWTSMTLLERRCAFWRLLESGDWLGLEHAPLDAWSPIKTWALGTPAKQSMPLRVVERLIEFCTPEAWVGLMPWTLVNDQSMLLATSLESLRDKEGNPWTPIVTLTAWSMGRRAMAETLEAAIGWDQGWSGEWNDPEHFTAMVAYNLWQPTEVQEAFAAAVERSIKVSIGWNQPVKVDHAFGMVIERGHSALQRAFLPHANGFHKHKNGNTALLSAVHHDRLWLTEGLLARDASPEHRLMVNYDGEHALLSAMNNDKDRFEALGAVLMFKDAVNLGNSRDENKNFYLGTTPWMVCGELLFDTMRPWADPQSRDVHGHTTLMYMAMQGHVENIKKWLPVVDARETSLTGRTALMVAAEYGHMDAVKHLLPHSDVHAENDCGMTAFLLALDEGHADIAEHLMPFSNVFHTNKKKSNALMIAAWGGCTTMVQRLTKHLDASAVNDFNNTALMFASHRGHVEVVRILALLCDAKHVGENQDTSLTWAAKSGHLDVVEALLPFSDPDHKGQNQRTALVHALVGKHRTVVQLLLGVGEQQCRDNGANLLVVSARQSTEDDLNLLITIAENPSITNDHRDAFFEKQFSNRKSDVCLYFDFREPLDTAAASSFVRQPDSFPQSLPKLVPTYGWNALMMAVLNNDESSFETHCTPENVRHASRDGWTALMVASFAGRASMVERLMIHGMHEALTESGKNAVMLAAEQGHTDVLTQLIPRMAHGFLVEKCKNLLVALLDLNHKDLWKACQTIASMSSLPLELRQVFLHLWDWDYAKINTDNPKLWRALDAGISPLPIDTYGEVFDHVVGMGLTVAQTLPQCWERWLDHLRTTTMVSSEFVQRKRL